MKTKKILNADFNYLQSTEPFTKSSYQKRQLKYQLLEKIELAFGDRYDNLKQGTKDALEHMCFLASDKGYFYATSMYFAEKHSVGKSTVDRVFKFLCDAQVMVKRNRPSSKQNGLGSPVYFFVNHPYFNKWSHYFAFNEKANEKAENTQTPCESKSLADKKVSTYYLPYINLNNHLMSATKIFKGVPKLINKLFSSEFKQSLDKLYMRTLIAYKTVSKQSNLVLTKEHKQQVSMQSIRVLFEYLKTHKLTLEEQFKYVYKVALNKFQAIATPKEETSKAATPAIGEPKPNNNCTTVKRKEKVPEWLSDPEGYKKRAKEELEAEWPDEKFEAEKKRLEAALKNLSNDIKAKNSKPTESTPVEPKVLPVENAAMSESENDENFNGTEWLRNLLNNNSSPAMS
ncbi:hypothetical protein COJ90_21185 [Priestia megaterium]|uniref:hypothetical protein n=1 Tax=Priestia megaterium TaxID=1404 RepID=UPI000BFA0C65|nr:hypothetical protein [Priestia megaterium]PFP09230.1 hypothetical protein COJ90_21185 [Priestia megaterium]